MKAIVCEKWTHYSELKIHETAPPVLSAGQVRIAVYFATAGFGQTLVIAGKYQRKPPLPFVPGTEISGVVLEVAPGVTEFSPGDRVAAALDWGGYAEEAVATVATTWHVPDAVSLATAASVPLTYGTAYAALHWRGRLKAGETMLVYGAAGGVGLPAVQLGRLAGARVIAVAGSEDRVKVAMAYGAHSGIVHGGGQLNQQVRANNGGRNVELVFDPVGGTLFDEALRCLRPEGRILVVGFASGEVPKIPANILLVKNAEIIGFNFGLYIGWGLTDEREYYMDRLRDMMQTLFAQVASGELEPISSTPYPLECLTEAFDSVIERRSVGRALLQIVPDSDL
ncbi:MULTISPECIES: NADPH:quinone oxidoreductase family protein [Polaromonas]|uniref:NADPH:quinone oxidoreductase family protein n=1 Tax=Polaromonas aquatica TaxID=332657 RepID=A0ABW1U2T0_9BURK